MHLLSAQIKDFVNDFHLENNNVICFTAIVFYTDKRHFVQMESEIHIISIIQKGLDLIYLLNPEVNNHGIPDMINMNIHEVFYEKNIYLLVKGHASTIGKYIISIHPNSETCSPYTINELHQKRFN